MVDGKLDNLEQFLLILVFQLINQVVESKRINFHSSEGFGWLILLLPFVVVSRQHHFFELFILKLLIDELLHWQLEERPPFLYQHLPHVEFDPGVGIFRQKLQSRNRIGLSDKIQQVFELHLGQGFVDEKSMVIEVRY